MLYYVRPALDGLKVMVNMSKKKRKKSRIIVPTDGVKDSLQAFRCDQDLKKILDKLENKSEFIVRALWKALQSGEWVTCPNCRGKGVVRL